MRSSDPYIHRVRSQNLKTWMCDEEDKIFFGDVVDESAGARLDATFIHWSKGESSAFDDPLPNDQVFVVTEGPYTIWRKSEGYHGQAPCGDLHVGGATGVYYTYKIPNWSSLHARRTAGPLKEAGQDDELKQLHEVEF